MSDQFTVSIGPITRRLEANGGDGVFLLVKVPNLEGSPEDFISAVESAMERANAALDRSDDVDVVWAAGVMPTLKGPMINLDWVGTEEQNHEWLDVFAETMEAAGYSGTITAAPQANLPQAISGDYFLRTRLTAYLAYRRTDPLPPHVPPAWRVADAVTDAICADAVRWGAFPGAAVYLGEGIAQVRVALPDVAGALATAARRSWSGRVTYLGRRPTRSRVVTLWAEGQVCYQAGGEGRSWDDDIDAVRHPLLRAPESLDLAYVRRRAGFGHSFMDLGGDPYELKYVDDLEVRHNRHLWSRYVPDPNGMQVLTKAHLEKAADLSGWRVKSLNEDRYLVEAHDLQPWYEPEVPPQDVIDAARADFGGMLLTREAIAADPNGWLRGQPLRDRT